MKDYCENDNYAYVHVKIECRKILRKKLLGIIPLYDNMPVFRLMYSSHNNGQTSESYEEYNSHKDIYERLATKPIYGQSFPPCVSINEFIDLGFEIKF